MKWIGLVVGMLFGAVLGVLLEFNTAFLRGFFGPWLHWGINGFLLGWLITLSREKRGGDVKETTAEITKDAARINAALGDIHWRLKRIETAQELGASPLEAAQTGVSHAIPPSATIDVPLQADAVKTTVDTGSSSIDAPEAPRAPNLIDNIRAWFLSGNTVAKVGAIILFFGVGFLIKYAADSGILSIETRLSAVVIAAIAALVMGWRLRTKNALFGQILQGTAIGVLYLTIFGAFKLYHLLPSTLAFGLMLVIVLLSGLLAVKQDALWLAVIGAAGGFLAPILTSTGGGSHVALFSYYALLSTGILGIAWFKAWRVLNLLGFGFTFGIGAMWGANAYRPEHFATTEPFLLLAIAFYIGVAVLFARHVATPKEAAVDATIVFGTPIAGFALQAALVRDLPFMAAFSAVGLAAVYLPKLTSNKKRDAVLIEKRFALIGECFLALGVIFATLAIPLALDGRWTSAAWALEGAAVIWVGIRQNRLLARLFGYLVQVAGAVAFAGSYGEGAHSAVLPVLNAPFIGMVMIALAALFTAFQVERAQPSGVTAAERVGGLLFFIAGVAWWLAAGVNETLGIMQQQGLEPQTVVVFLTASAWLAYAVGRKLAWARMALLIVGFLPALVIAAVFLGLFYDQHALLRGIGLAAWPLALVSHYVLLRRWEANSEEAAEEHAQTHAFAPWLHALGGWFLAAFVSHELLHWVNDAALRQTAWRTAAWVSGAVALLVWLSSRFAGARWPVAAQRNAYLHTAALPLIVLTWLWIFFANVSYRGGDVATFYLPLLNVLDLTHVAVGLTWFAWRKALLGAGLALPFTRVQRLAAEGVAAFVWLNGMLLRSLHHWADVPYRLDTMLRSVLVQTALSIFWTVLAFALMFTAKKKALRPLWLVGAALMAVVVAKLFLVDLSNIGGIERIISFIGVGVLMLAIGYFAPLPAKPMVAITEEDKPA